MDNYQREFLQFVVESDVLRFGEFELKSGRVSPYFFNAGLFNHGVQLASLGRFYAAAVEASGIEFDVIFGPAYKGIPLAASLAIALAAQPGRDVPFCFNRKETKAHSEGGKLVGAPLNGRVLIVDDVITAGTAIRESVAIIRAAGATAAGVVVSLDRQEKGRQERSAIQEIEQDAGIPVVSIVTLEHLIEYLADDPTMTGHLAAIRGYRDTYGI